MLRDEGLMALWLYRCRKKHKKHKRSKKAKEAAENGNGAVIDKIVTQIVNEKELNGKLNNVVHEVGETEDSEEEKLVDLDSDEVDCTIIEDDIDLEELMKQKVRLLLTWNHSK